MSSFFNDLQKGKWLRIWKYFLKRLDRVFNSLQTDDHKD